MVAEEGSTVYVSYDPVRGARGQVRAIVNQTHEVANAAPFRGRVFCSR
jgi:hypothetical protein